MGWTSIKPLAPYLWTFLPMYGMEHLAEYYYLDRNPASYLISGWRLEVFIISALAGSVASGAFLKDYRLVLATQSTAIGSFFVSVYLLCVPRLCYSAGPDGFEPVRFALFLGAVAASGGAIGVGSRGVLGNEKWKVILVGFAGFFAVGYYPVIFTFAGARLLPPFDPWALAGVMFALGLATSLASRDRLGARASFLVPLLALTLLLGASFGIALAYLDTLGLEVLLMLAAVVAGAVLGSYGRESRKSRRQRSTVPVLLLLSVILVLTMTVVVIPDAVSGVIPAAPPATNLMIGVPVYAGAYQVAPQGITDGVRVTISFTGTNASAIQGDNFLSAGLGIHSANCCTDGIDYGYRFDLVLFHNGSEALVASGWEACDDVAACGGHSWKVLLYSHEEELAGSSGNATLMMVWNGGDIRWLYSVEGGPIVNFTSFGVPPPENHDFNTGVSGEISHLEEKAVYFYQFGIMSGYPIGHGGWQVALACPSTLVNSSWTCVDHASSLQGSHSFWKVIWRWGEDYPDVSVSSPGAFSVVFAYDKSGATESFSTLW